MMGVGRPMVEVTSMDASPASVVTSSSIDRSGVVRLALARDLRAGVPWIRRLPARASRKLATARVERLAERRTHPCLENRQTSLRCARWRGR
jgi:hypothetical protein